MPDGPDCNWDIENSKILNIHLSTFVSICYFWIYLLLILIVSVYASRKPSLFEKHTINTKLSIYDKCKPYLKCYIFVLLHFSIQSINIGVIVQLYFIFTTNCTSDFPVNSLNINALFHASLAIFILYRIISAFKIYTMTYNITNSIIQFLFDYCIIKSLYVELIKYKNIPLFGKHYIQICHCFQWFLRIQSYFYAAPMAFVQLVILLLYLQFNEEKEFNLYYMPILISLFLCFIDVIAVSFESDSIIFNPHSFNRFKIWFIRLLFRILDISVRLISMALFWVTVGGYFVIFIAFIETLYIFIACIKLQLQRYSNTHSNGRDIHSPVSPSSLKGMSTSRRGKVRISNEYKNKTYLYRPNSIGKLTIDHANPSNSVSILNDEKVEEYQNVFDDGKPLKDSAYKPNIVNEIKDNDNEEKHVYSIGSPVSRNKRAGLEIESHPTAEHTTAETGNKCLCNCCYMILHVLDYYINGMIIILISFRYEDRSTLFSMWFWRYRVLTNIILMLIITIFGYLNIYCKYVCFYEEKYESKLSFIQKNENDYYIGFILFIYAWIACIILPFIFIYLANGKIKTDKYSCKNFKDIMIVGDIIGIFELEVFGIFKSNKNKNLKQKHAYHLTACNLHWFELNNNILMQYLYILKYSQINFNEIYDPYDHVNNTLMNQLCMNQFDVYQWININEIQILLNENKNNPRIIALCCQNGNFRIFKNIIKHFGNKYLNENRIISLHYALHCRGKAIQQKQAMRIVVYILKNCNLTIDTFLHEYNQCFPADTETIEMERIIEKKRHQIEHLYQKTLEKTKRNSGNHLYLDNEYINEKDEDRSELLSPHLSNNSIVTIDFKNSFDDSNDSNDCSKSQTF